MEIDWACPLVEKMGCRWVVPMEPRFRWERRSDRWMGSRIRWEVHWEMKSVETSGCRSVVNWGCPLVERMGCRLEESWGCRSVIHWGFHWVRMMGSPWGRRWVTTRVIPRESLWVSRSGLPMGLPWDWMSVEKWGEELGEELEQV